MTSDFRVGIGMNIEKNERFGCILTSSYAVIIKDEIDLRAQLRDTVVSCLPRLFEVLGPDPQLCSFF